MPDIVDFPEVLRITDRTDPQLVFATRSGGVALDGGEQVMAPLTARWEWRANIVVLDKADARSLRVLRARLKGRFNYLRMRVCDRYRITRSDIGALPMPDGVPFGDGAHFSDGTDFSLAQPSAPILAGAAATATEISVPASAFSGALSAGVFFSINDWLYQVDDWEEDGDTYTLTISPPLREAVTTDDEAEFDARAIWVFATDEEGGIDLRLGRTGVVQLTLLEPVGRRLDAA